MSTFAIGEISSAMQVKASSAKPSAIFAMMFAVAGAMSSKSALSASSMCAGFQPSSSSYKSVITDLYDEEEGWKPAHIELADNADLLLIAPATANIIAKIALGLADDALTCIALEISPIAKVLMAPAMNGKMWQHPAT